MQNTVAKLSRRMFYNKNYLKNFDEIMYERFQHHALSSGACFRYPHWSEYKEWCRVEWHISESTVALRGRYEAESAHGETGEVIPFQNVFSDNGWVQEVATNCVLHVSGIPWPARSPGLAVRVSSYVYSWKMRANTKIGHTQYRSRSVLLGMNFRPQIKNCPVFYSFVNRLTQRVANADGHLQDVSHHG